MSTKPLTPETVTAFLSSEIPAEAFESICFFCDEEVPDCESWWDLWHWRVLEILADDPIMQTISEQLNEYMGQ